MGKHPLFDIFIRERTVAILRGLSPGNAVACGDALVRAGVRLMEVPLNRPGALESIRLLAEHFAGNGIVVGARTGGTGAGSGRGIHHLAKHAPRGNPPDKGARNALHARIRHTDGSV